MSRGIIYHIAVEPDDLGGMSADDFAEHIDQLNVDYVNDQSLEDARQSTGWLFDRMAKAGFAPAEPAPGEEGMESVRFLFRTGTAAETKTLQMNWFRDDLQSLKDLVASAELEAFATDTGLAYKIKELTSDDNGDAVYLDMNFGPATYALDHFIRELQPDTVYYVGTDTVYMH